MLQNNNKKKINKCNIESIIVNIKIKKNLE